MTDVKFDTALIVGAGAGLSASLARVLAKEGIKVALAARTTGDLDALARDTGALAFACDASQIGRCREAVRRPRGRPRGARDRDLQCELPHARSVRRSRSGRGRKVDRGLRFRRLSGGAAGGAPHAAKRHGAILFTGASASVKGYAQSAPFAMGKFALRGLAQSMARELVAAGHSCGPYGDRRRHQERAPRRAGRRARRACSTPMRSRPPICTSFASRAAPGPSRSSCGPGWRGFERHRRERHCREGGIQTRLPGVAASDVSAWAPGRSVSVRQSGISTVLAPSAS